MMISLVNECLPRMNIFSRNLPKRVFMSIATAAICLTLFSVNCGGGFGSDSDNARTLSGPLFGDTTEVWRRELERAAE